jgi:hypothetical protein
MIRIVCILVLQILFLHARENPFVPTQTFMHEKESILENTKKTNRIQYNKKSTDRQNDEPIDQNILADSKPIDTTQNQPREIPPMDLPSDTAEKFNPDAQINGVLVKESFPFSYLNIKEYENGIVVSSPYAIKTKFMINNPYKIAIDFKAKVKDKSTVIRLKDNPLFSKIVFGNHRSKGYFRIVMYANNDPKTYKRMYTKNDIIIQK